MLYVNKLRWSPAKCKCVSYSEPSNDKDRLCALTDLAFTMFAAELLWHGCKRSNLCSQDCIAYLLEQAPNLINIRVPLHSYRVLIRVAIQYHSSIAAKLARKGSMTEQVGDSLNELYSHSLDLMDDGIMDGSTIHIGRDTQCLVQGHGKEVAQYRNTHGCSLLHILYHQAVSVLYFQHDELVSATISFTAQKSQ